jgi:hypothetical protein
MRDPQAASVKFKSHFVPHLFRHVLEISLCQGPKPAVFAGRKKTIRCFVVGPMNRHSESENFLKFLLTRANFSRFNPGEISWIKPFQETSPGDFGRGI